MNINNMLRDEFKLRIEQVQSATELIDEGKTIPFIARYRKEQTGEMSDEVLRDFFDRLKYLRNLCDRKETVVKSIDEQGKLTQEIEKALESAMTMVEVEDIYEPYKKKRKTRASLAVEKGLEALALIIIGGNGDHETRATEFVNEDLLVNSEKEALDGASDIIAQMIADDFEIKKPVRDIVNRESLIETSLKKDGDKKETALTYSMYYEFSELAKNMPAHRILAIDRGEKEDVLKVKIIHSQEKIESIVRRKYIQTKNHEQIMASIIEDALKRLMLPSLERELRSEMSEKAGERAISVFGKNLSNLLMQSPLHEKVVLGWDPAFRTGCKIAVVDQTGKLLDTATVYPAKPQEQIEETRKTILSMIEKNKVDVIAIGNGTASRESEKIVADIIKDSSRDVKYIIVSEAGASIYSASKLGTEEFPDLNVSIRGAVSIARRLIDPLAELVKIDPEHIGVGQYQHDVNQGRLKEALNAVVESSVNNVGVDLNTASVALLSHVSGISASIAKNIIEYREEAGRFKSRKELLKVKRLGNGAFEQCAGFLRIKDAKEVLDNTSVHPESYIKAKQLMQELGVSSEELLASSKDAVSKLEEAANREMAQKLDLGLPTLKDIISELKKPGRDIREALNAVILKSDILDLDDLSIGTTMQGTVRNVVDFGAFVDIGLKNDGLVHISELSNSYVKDPMSVVAVGDIVDVRVIGIDRERNKVKLSMKK
ncbi:Tex family protein [Proteocatella sphenisci]|uniref:Tex family protein n=1 Tax=Proteocatella sphenisci TaxID=181070 RepID=UPI00048A7A37|nr:Tex family protein [Proteocatella sphenisci]